ncbi:MAG TPA: hypothetical protein VFG43_05830, partial [Geminicoccaceae bacterium]|nr:hypothetical protein [Geminicoccaceae bacterium]
MTDDGENAWVEVRRFPTWAEAEQHALVLAAVGNDRRLVAHAGAIVLLAARPDAPRARRELAAYAWENRRQTQPSMRGLAEGLDGALAYSAVLLFLHGASR